MSQSIGTIRKSLNELSITSKRKRPFLTPEEKEQYLEYQRQFSLKSHTTTQGRAGVLCRSSKQSAKLLNVPFDLTKEWIKEKLDRGCCEVTGIPFDLSNRNPGSRKKGAGNVQKYAPSLDRLNPQGGYTKDNVRLVVWMYNVGKQNYTHNELVEFAHILVQSQIKAGTFCPIQPCFPLQDSVEAF